VLDTVSSAVHGAPPSSALKPDTKAHEKEYLRRSGGGAWELSKPFPPSGQMAGEEHAQHILDFGVMLRTLAPTASDLVLDLGAGSCWVSDWLRRCGVRTVAVDISLDMLGLGKRRMGSAAGLAAGDMEALPFRDGTFSKACCLNAFHHVPDQEAALREICRVLTPDGVVFFSEPGAGHAENPTSIAAARNYGVLEQDILIDEFMDACRRAGFADVLLHPISHVLPLFVLDRSQWHDWRTYTRSIRPARALTKMWRAALEMIGARKQDLLFEEALAIRLGRELEPVIEQHPVITAHRSPFVRPTAARDRASIHLLAADAIGRAGLPIRLQLELTNTGNTHWPASGPTDESIRIGIQLLNPDGRLIDRDYARHALPSSLAPGGRQAVDVTVVAPPAAGTYLLKIDLVREGRGWFELSGSAAVVHQLTVTPDTR
jgi:SAM-dependent methyltransferase